MPSSNLSWQQNRCFNLLDCNVELHTLLVKFGQHPEQNDLDEWGPPLENGEASWNTKMVVYVWVNYNDVTTTSLEIIVSIREIIPFYGLISG